jgi:hypothetical protein
VSTTRIKPLLTWRGAITDSDLPATARHVALTLSLYMNEVGSSAFPSIVTLARKTGLGESTVRDYLHQLRDTGWLVAGERGRPSVYHATPDHKGESHGGRHRTVFYTATIPPDFLPAEENPPAAGEFLGDEARKTPQEPAENPPAAGGDLFSNSPRRSIPVGGLFDEVVEVRVATRMAGRQVAKKALRSYTTATRESVRDQEGSEIERLVEGHPDWTAQRIADAIVAMFHSAHPDHAPATGPVAIDSNASSIRALRLAGLDDEADELAALAGASSR